MPQPRGDPDLALEALCAERGAELGEQDLERDAAVVLAVVDEIDRGHPAATQLALDDVRGAQRLTEAAVDRIEPPRVSRRLG
jgi:hypothetical protein